MNRCTCMTEDPRDGYGERVVTHSLSCKEHPEHDATAAELTANQKEAVRLLGVYTAGSFKFFTLAGGHKASCRAHIMSQLKGVRVPQSKAGINAMRDEFFAIANPPGDCEAAKEDAFVQWAKGNLTKATPAA